MKTRRFSLLFAFATASSCVSSAIAANYQWNASSGSSDWTTTGNWSTVGPNSGLTAGPGASGVSGSHRLNVNGSVALVYSSAQGTTVYANTAGRGLVIGSPAGNPGSFTISGGTFSTLGSFQEDYLANSIGTSTLTLAGGTFISTAAGMIIGGGNGTGVLQLNSGTASIHRLLPQAGGTSIINFNGATLQARASLTTFVPAAVSSVVQSGGAVIDTQSFNVTFASALNAGSGSTGGLTKSGPGVLTLTAAGSFAGATQINAGAIVATANGVLGTTAGGTTIAGGASLGLSGNINYSTTEALSLRGTGVASANTFFAGSAVQRGAIQSVSGDNTFAGNIVVDATGTTRIGVQDGAKLNLTGSITLGSGVTGVTMLFRAGNLDGDFVTLSNSGNSWDTDTTIYSALNSSTQHAGVRLGADDALPTGVSVTGASGAFAGTALDLNSFDQTVAGLVTNSQLKITNLASSGTSILTLDGTTNRTSSVTSVVDGPNGGSVGLVKDGSFTQTLSGGTFSYTGTTTISDGVLALTGATKLSGTSQVSVQSGATFDLSGASTSTTLGGSSSQSLVGDGLVDLGVNTLTIGTDGSVAPGNSPGTLTFDVSSGGKLDFAAGSSVLFELGTSSDLIAFSSAGDWLSGSGNAELALSLLGGFDYGDTYTIFDNVTTSGFSFGTITGYDDVNYTANFAQSGSQYQLSFTAIPEPSVFLLGSLAFVSLAGIRRRH
jgi:autotransporter-associated beta strand protein